MEHVKRRRTELACSKCRSRKAKCDGRRPACTRCQSDGVQCLYEEVPRAHTTEPRKSKSTLALETRVAQLEQELASQHNTALTRSLPSIPTPPEQGTTFTCMESVEVPPATSIISHQRTATIPVFEEESLIDTLATADFSQEPEIGIGHFGPSSNHAFFRITSVIFARLPKNGASNHSKLLPRWPNERPSRIANSGSRHLRADACCSTQFPDDDTARLYFQQFFEVMTLTMPFIHKADVMEQYHQARVTNFQHLGKIQKALLNMIWACGASCCSHPVSENFYRRAMSLLNAISIREAGEDMVRFLLLVCSFQQNHQRSVASWTFHSLLVKSAFQMGLHYPLTYVELSTKEREKRRILWFCVLNHDSNRRYLSSALGRPCLIPRQYARIKMTRPEPKSHANGHTAMQRSLDGTEMLFYLSTFYDIIASIAETLYDHNMEELDLGTDDLLVQHMQLHLKLEAWKESFSPPWTTLLLSQIERHGAAEHKGQCLSILLSIHYRRAQLWLHRPILIRALEAWSQETVSVSRSFLETSSSIFKADFETAKEVLGIVNKLMLSDTDFLHKYASWFLANYTVFGACIHLFGILLGCVLKPEVLNDALITVEGARASLQYGLDVLQSVGRKSLMSQKGAACMLRFLDAFDTLVKAEAAPHYSNGEQPLNTFTYPVDDSALQLTFNSLSEYITQATDDFFMFSSSWGGINQNDFTFLEPQQ